MRRLGQAKSIKLWLQAELAQSLKRLSIISDEWKGELNQVDQTSTFELSFDRPLVHGPYTRVGLDDRKVNYGWYDCEGTPIFSLHCEEN